MKKFYIVFEVFTILSVLGLFLLLTIGTKDNSLIMDYIIVLVIYLTIIILFIIYKSRLLSILLLIISAITFNGFGFALAIVNINQLSNKNNNDNSNDVDSNNDKDVRSSKVIISKTNMTLLILSLVISVLYIVGYIFLDYFFILHLCGEMLKNIQNSVPNGPEALAYIFVLIIVGMVWIVVCAIITAIPIIIFLFNIIFTIITMTTKNRKCFYILRVIGFIYLTILNAVAAIRVIKEDELYYEKNELN